VVLSPQANYTDWATATCRRNLVPTFTDRGVSCGQRGGTHTVVNLSFLDQSHYLSFKWLLIYPHKGWVDPVPDSPLLRKSGSVVNRTRNLWFSSQKLWPLDHRGGCCKTVYNKCNGVLESTFQYSLPTLHNVISIEFDELYHTAHLSPSLPLPHHVLMVESMQYAVLNNSHYIREEFTKSSHLMDH
jgi:hypothetical protein